MPNVAHDHNWTATAGGWLCAVPPCTAKCSDQNLLSNPPPTNTNSPGLDNDDVIDAAFRAVTGAAF